WDCSRSGQPHPPAVYSRQDSRQYFPTMRRMVDGAPSVTGAGSTMRRIVGKEKGGLGGEALGEVGAQALKGYALLRHRVAFAHCRGPVVERIEVDRDAIGRADLILPPVASPDRTRVVE